MKIMTILLIITMSTYSCQKGKAKVTIKGIITDTSFATPLSDATVDLYQIESGVSDELIGQTTTNSNGEYSFTFDRDQTEYYRITSTKTDYYDLNESISFSDITINNDNVYDFSTAAKSWVKLRFHNPLGQITDVFKYIKQEGKSGCDDCCPETEQVLNGIIDTTIVYANNGNEIFSYHYFVTGTTNQGLKSTTTVAFDTTLINLTY